MLVVNNELIIASKKNFIAVAHPNPVSVSNMNEKALQTRVGLKQNFPSLTHRHGNDASSVFNIKVVHLDRCFQFENRILK